MVLIIIVSFIV